jgi:hypothetical protein
MKIRLLLLTVLTTLLWLVPLTVQAAGGGVCIPALDTILWDWLGDFIKLVLYGDVNCQ